MNFFGTVCMDSTRLALSLSLLTTTIAPHGLKYITLFLPCALNLSIRYGYEYVSKQFLSSVPQLAHNPRALHSVCTGHYLLDTG